MDNKNNGFILLEYLYLLFISSIILFASTGLFFSLLKIAKKHTDLDLLQDSASEALNILANNIEHAGYMGCLSLDQNFTENITVEPKILKKLNFLQSIYNYSKDGLDAIEILSVKKYQKLDVNPINKNILVVINDCQHADIGFLSSLQLSKNYNPAFTQIAKIVKNTYFVSNNYLYVTDISGVTNQLVPNIAIIKIELIYKNSDKNSEIKGAKIKVTAKKKGADYKVTLAKEVVLKSLIL